MQLTISHKDIKAQLTDVAYAQSDKPALPILVNYKLRAVKGASGKPGFFEITATDLSVGIVRPIAAEVEQEGECLVQAKMFEAIIKAQPETPIRLVLDRKKGELRIQSDPNEAGDFEFDNGIKALDIDEYPSLPAVGGKALTTIAAADLDGVDTQVCNAAMKPGGDRPVLEAVYARFKESTLTLVAADGHQFAYKEITLGQKVAKEVTLLIPAPTMAAVAKAMKDSATPVEIVLDEKGGAVLFRSSRCEIVSRLIDGKYVAWEAALPKKIATRLVMDTGELAKAVKLAAIIAAPGANLLQLTIKPTKDGQGKLMLAAEAAEVGDSKGGVDGTLEGDEVKIVCHVGYLATALDSMKTAQVAIEIEHPHRPSRILPVGQESRWRMAMPMSIRTAPAAA